MNGEAVRRQLREVQSAGLTRDEPTCRPQPDLVQGGEPRITAFIPLAPAYSKTYEDMKSSLFQRALRVS